MSIRWRLTPPPRFGNMALDGWLDSVYNTINQLPAFSIFSTRSGPNESGVTADSGTFGIDVGSSATTFWVKVSGSTTTGWSSLDFT